MQKDDLKLVVFDNMKEMGEKVNQWLNVMLKTDTDYVIPVKAIRFNNGEGKVQIDLKVWDANVFVLSDVHNYGVTYMLHGREREMSPDEHFQDVKRVISAISGNASQLSVLMPMLYQSRQHRRREGESADCAIALQELERFGVKRVITFDAHDPNIGNALSRMSLNNFYPTSAVLKKLLEENGDNLGDIIVIGPDKGAMERAKRYAYMLECESSVYEKERDTTQVVDGKNQILKHQYDGGDVRGKDVIVVDDMIDSGQSMLDVAYDMKRRGAKNVYLTSTFALFTKGICGMDDAYQEGYFDKLYVPNLSYVPEEFKEREWYSDVDMSYDTADIIKRMHEHEMMRTTKMEQEDLKPYVRKRQYKG